MSVFTTQHLRTKYPLAFLLRDKINEHWFRFHSLPESKRYAESEEEWITLIDRHREVSDIVLGHGSRCSIYCAFYSDTAIPDDISSTFKWRRHNVFNQQSEEVIYSYVTEGYWDFDTFIDLIKQVANDEVRHISFHSHKTDAMYCPYDGGADVFSFDESFMNDIRSKFTHWKSAHSTGL